MRRPLSVGDHRGSIVLDVIGTVSIFIYIVFQFRGPIPAWVQGLYLGGALAGGIAAFVRRNRISAVCFGIVVVVSAYQFIYPQPT